MATATTALRPGTQIGVRVIAFTPPSPGSPPPPAISAAGAIAPAIGTLLNATVIGTTSAGQPIVHTEAGVFALATRSALPIGSFASLEVIEEPAAPKPLLAVPEGGLRQMVAQRSWPALNEAVAILQQTDPAYAQQLISTVLPRPDSQLAASILYFLAALRGGDIRAWFGEGPSRSLERAKPGSLSRLGEEFAQLRRASDEPVSGNWRMALIPLYSGTDIEQVRLFMRRHGEDAEDGEEGENGGIRFVVDVELSRLGRMQFDGLVRGRTQRFDLIVRTAEELPSVMANDIRRIFEETLALTAIKGSIVFQSGPADFVEIKPESAAEPLGLIV